MPPRLSARQEQCVRLTAFRTDKEIAVHLGISEATVKKHIHEACQRLGVNRRKAALAILNQEGPPPSGDALPATAQAHPALDHEVAADPVLIPSSAAGAAGSGLAVPVDPTSPPGGLVDVLLNYRPPPRGVLFRFTMVGVIAIVICAMLVVIGGMVTDLHHILDRFDPQS